MEFNNVRKLWNAKIDIVGVNSIQNKYTITIILIMELYVKQGYMKE